MFFFVIKCANILMFSFSNSAYHFIIFPMDLFPAAAAAVQGEDTATHAILRKDVPGSSGLLPNNALLEAMGMLQTRHLAGTILYIHLSVYVEVTAPEDAFSICFVWCLHRIYRMQQSSMPWTGKGQKLSPLGRKSTANRSGSIKSS